MNLNKIVIAAVIILSPLSVNALDVGVGFKGGTTGVGFDLSVAITKTVNVRFSTTSYDFGDQNESVDINDADTTIKFDATLGADFGAQGILFDWYVFDGTFHLTAGLVKNTSTMGFSGAIDGATVTFDGTDYDVSDFDDATISGELSFGSNYEPYIGVGWGRKASSDPGFSFTAEIGVMLLDPSVKLTAPTLASGNITDQNTINADVEASESSANDELGDFEAWPVISLGINYAF